MVSVESGSGGKLLDLHRLHQFLAVAELSSFTSAAARLHITQQALSSSVRQLEKQLRVELFDRSNRQLVLTEAGRVLRDGARALLAASDALYRRTYEAGIGAQPTFVVGHTPAITADEVFDLLAPVRAGAPDVSVTVRQMYPDELARALHDGTIDVALRRGVESPPDLAAAVIAYHQVRVAVAGTHRLAERAAVTVRDLQEEQIVIWAPPGASYYTDFILSTCRRAGFEPRFAVNHIQGTPPVTAVVGTEHVAVVTAPAGPALGGRVRVIELKDGPVAATQALWLPHTTSDVRDLLLGTRADDE
ncbi:LysR family transcriptional regulator [Nocardia brasiliensis]|uniref:LysR family transcriptional regulator n=1 Tax=Nocardia brasiliensis TaxID=37326 RepID=A0A6G9XQX8_NOCBR|nr:LysR substrate-binding domain-containing protein [Nocardia brasiliensis]QIS03351.1 LysR family transcriptional regulator [Nocardia brasiliensis]